MTGLPETYEQSRYHFRNDLTEVQRFWPEARLDNHPLAGEEDLSIDWIFSNARKDKQKLFILTTGEHGIEGYAGSAMLQLFMEEFLPRLNPDNIGIRFVHIINPWGMKHRRHTNAANVDLNRSFLRDFSSLSGFNPDYDLLSPLLEPTRPLKNIAWDKIAFIFQTLISLSRYGMVRLREATLRGQFSHPQGIYFGGQCLAEETGLMMQLFEKSIHDYTQMLTMDMHTGYGPRGRMTLVTSAQEKMNSKQMVAKFGIPLVAATNPEEFYSIQGDMIEYLYTLMQKNFPNKKFFAAACEFGTLGDSIGAVIRSLCTIVFENHLYWYGGNDATRRKVCSEYDQLYSPPDLNWLEQAQQDCRQAFEGVLQAEGFW